LNNIVSLWPTNVLYEAQAPEATQEFLSEILAIGEEYEAAHPEAHVPAAMRTNKENVYNLLADPRPACQLFKQMLKSRMLDLARAEGFLNSVAFEAVTSLRKFAPGEYAKPHNHRSVDYVAVLWIALEDTDPPNNNTHQRMTGNRLHLIDPMPSRSRFLNHTMLFPISPRAGTLLIHPASTFHTTEANLGSVDTIALATNIKVVDPARNYVTL